jgi:large subunit ribosomal protein L45
MPALQQHASSASTSPVADTPAISRAAPQLVTNNMDQKLQIEANARKQAGWERIVWRMLDPPGTGKSKVKILQASIAAMDPRLTGPVFIQLTLDIQSKQSFAAYNSKGQLVAGDPDEALNVVDQWVFERKAVSKRSAGGFLHNPMGAAWRVVGRLAPQLKPKKA